MALRVHLGDRLRHTRQRLSLQTALDRFGQAFAGVRPDEAATLAASCRFENCVEGAELSEVLRTHVR